MKITKTQLRQIIKEELNEVYVDRADPGFQKWLSQQEPSALEREMEMRPSLERRVDRLEEKLDEIIQKLEGTATRATEVELEE